MPVTLVKICGITNAADADAAVAAGAAMLGFNFYPRSPRYVDPEIVRSIVETLPPNVTPVGVFVDEPAARAGAIAAVAGVRVLQFHGNEDQAYCDQFNCPIIKAVRVRDMLSVEAALRYRVNYLLVDAYVEGKMGGTGQSIAPALLEGVRRDNLILAGGLTPENVAAAVRLIRPYAVDVASGVEREPGRKDHEKMGRFVANVLAA
jgi:phosphoribosylanthranilate isomerase